MVDRIKILEELEEKVSVMGREIFSLDEESYNKESVSLERALSLMHKIYDYIKEKHSEEPIVKHIRKFYSDAWNVLLPPAYEMRFDYAE